MNAIEMKRSLREALSPHLENLRMTKKRVSAQEFNYLITEFKRRIMEDPTVYLAGVENSRELELLIESVIDEVEES